MSPVECYSCGSRSGETPFPIDRNAKGKPVKRVARNKLRLCVECCTEWPAHLALMERVAERRKANARWAAYHKPRGIHVQADLLVFLEGMAS